VGDVEFLKERALQFLEMSKAAAERGFYELVCTLSRRYSSILSI
jgi:HEPN domain-containing protein